MRVFNLPFGINPDSSLLDSCGDDGRIRGWRWKELTSFKYNNISSEGNNMLQL